MKFRLHWARYYDSVVNISLSNLNEIDSSGLVNILVNNEEEFTSKIPLFEITELNKQDIYLLLIGEKIEVDAIIIKENFNKI